MYKINYDGDPDKIINIAAGANVTTTVTSQWLRIKTDKGFLTAETSAALATGYGTTLAYVPNVCYYNTFYELNSIRRIQIGQWNGYSFAAGSEFKIYAVRR